MPLQFTYNETAPGLPGMVDSAFEHRIVHTVLSAESQGFEPGQGVFVAPNATAGIVPSQGNRYFRGIRVSPAAGSRIAGFVPYVAGFPVEPNQPTYQNGQPLPVLVQGRMWIPCENFAIDPLTQTDNWYIRAIAGAGPAIPGNLRYLDDDAGNCIQIASGHFRAVRYQVTGGYNLVLCEFDFTGHVSFTH